MEFTRRFFGPSTGFDFEILIGLEEGYGSGVLHTRGEFIAPHREWVRMQKKGTFIPTGVVHEATLLYAWATEGSEMLDGHGTEPAIVLRGRVHPAFIDKTPEENVWRSLESLAQFVGGRLGQKRIYVRFAEKELVLERRRDP